MTEYRKGSHTVYDIKYHVVWATKYRYKIIKGDIAIRLRELLKQGCEAERIVIIKGNISPDHVHMLISCPTNMSPAKIVQYLKGRSSRLIQNEFPKLKKKYWGQHFWATGYFCATVGNVTEDMIKEYIENQGKEEEDVFKITE
jgi:putative transposase